MLQLNFINASEMVNSVAVDESNKLYMFLVVRYVSGVARHSLLYTVVTTSIGFQLTGVRLLIKGH